MSRLFSVTRTSSYVGKPCEEAYEIEVKKVDTRSCDCPSKILFYKGTTSWWYREGTNHRVENGFIKRDLGTKRIWVVELDDILEFVSKYGECVLSYDSDLDMYCFEIYDDYRE